MSRRMKAALLAVAGAALSANAQVNLFDAGPHCTVRFDATNTGTYAYNQLGLSSGNLGGANTQRWIASPFSLNSASTVSEIRVLGFVPAGSEFSQLAWKIWNRTGTNAPVQADLVAQGSVATPTGVADPRVPDAGNVLFTIPITPGVALPAGNYYVTVYGDVPLATAANFAWFCNAQKDTLLCPVNTPITMFNGTVYHTWRSAAFPTPGFALYSPPVTTLTTSDQPAWGPNPQDPKYLYNMAFTILGAGTPPTGACCLGDGTCLAAQTAVQCCTAGGIYQGDSSACGSCPQPGACCLEDGSCASLLQTVCVAQGGLYRGPNKPCGAGSACFKFGHNEGGNDAGPLPASAQDINGKGQALNIIRGEMQLDDIDMYQFRICDEANFSATTAGPGTEFDTILCLFNSTGRGVAMSDDTLNIPGSSTISSQFVTANGRYYIAVSQFNNTALVSNLPSSASGLIWIDHQAAPQGEWAPDGAGAADPITGWGVLSLDDFGFYAIRMTGACFLGCYADCDGSGGLTANDFQCFLDSYANAANGTGYANCDRSTGNPALTANDFQCFINSFASGCPN